MFTRGELDGVTVVTAVTVVVLILTCAWAAWLQDRDTRRLRAVVDYQAEELAELRAWCQAVARALGWDDGGHGGGHGDDDPDEPDPDDGPATVVAHPADTWARKAALLDRYAHIGQHRT